MRRFGLITKNDSRMKFHPKIFLLLFVMLLLSPSAVPASDSSRTDQLRSTAENCLRKGNFQDALAVYRQIAESSPDPENCAAARLRMGDIYSAYMGNGDAALEQYSVVASKYGRTRFAADALFNSGMILYEKKNYPEALKKFRLFMEISPSGERVIAAKIMIDYCLTETSRPAVIRVLVLSDVQDVVIKSPGRIECLNQTGAQGKTIADIPAGKPARFYAEGQYLRAGVIGDSKMTGVLLASRNGPINVNGKNYRGRIKISVNGRKHIDVINILDIESYLKGVVPREMNGNWDQEALKAQAVVARTYALYQIEKNARDAYDICSTTNSQVYGGMDAELENSNLAVDRTRGVILLRGDRPALVYYHANSAGKTEDALNVWNTDIPYLKGKDDAFSVKMTDLDWSCSLSLDAIRNVLGKKNLKLGRISDIEIIDKTSSGRVKNMLIRHGGGKELNLSGNQFRTMVDPTVIKSAFFVVKKIGNAVRFEGRGAGHGVGMSQWGALVMAREGFSYSDILKFYYPGLEIRK